MFRPRSLILKTVSLSLSFVFLATHCAFAHRPEMNIWEERKTALALALPVLRHPGTSLARIQPSEQLDPGLRHSRMTATLLPYGSIRKVSKSQISNSKLETIIHIQDIHRNAEAQKNIAAAVRELVKSNQASVIALEGAFGEIDLTPFQTFPHQDSVKKAADFLLREKEITGPIHSALTASSQLRVIGVDDRAHYDANVDAYRQAVPLMKSLKKQLARERRELTKKKSQIFNAPLSAFDAKVESYRAGDISLGDYFKGLASSLQLTANSSMFLEALRLESTINFSQVEHERSHLLTELLPRLTKQQSDDLMAAGAAYRAERMNHAEFYSHLKNLCDKNDIPLSRFPTMQAYLRYVLLSDQIDAEKLFTEVKTLEAQTYESLTSNDQERTLIAESKRLYLTEKLADFALTREEWEDYKATNENRESKIDQGVIIFESFYREAEVRDEKMADNLLKAVTSSVTVLVTGGFHSSGVDRQLAEAGYTVVSFVPKITKVDTENGSAYLSVFTQQKTPLAKLFEGQKLFLAEAPIDPLRARVATVAQETRTYGNFDNARRSMLSRYNETRLITNKPAEQRFQIGLADICSRFNDAGSLEQLKIQKSGISQAQAWTALAVGVLCITGWLLWGATEFSSVSTGGAALCAPFFLAMPRFLLRPDDPSGGAASETPRIPQRLVDELRPFLGDRAVGLSVEEALGFMSEEAVRRRFPEIAVYERYQVTAIIGRYRYLLEDLLTRQQDAPPPRNTTVMLSRVFRPVKISALLDRLPWISPLLDKLSKTPFPQLRLGVDYHRHPDDPGVQGGKVRSFYVNAEIPFVPQPGYPLIEEIKVKGGTWGYWIDSAPVYPGTKVYDLIRHRLGILEGEEGHYYPGRLWFDERGVHWRTDDYPFQPYMGLSYPHALREFNAYEQLLAQGFLAPYPLRVDELSSDVYLPRVGDPEEKKLGIVYLGMPKGVICLGDLLNDIIDRPESTTNDIYRTLEFSGRIVRQLVDSGIFHTQSTLGNIGFLPVGPDFVSSRPILQIAQRRYAPFILDGESILLGRDLTPQQKRGYGYWSAAVLSRTSYKNYGFRYKRADAATQAKLGRDWDKKALKGFLGLSHDPSFGSPEFDTAFEHGDTLRLQRNWPVLALLLLIGVGLWVVTAGVGAAISGYATCAPFFLAMPKEFLAAPEHRPAGGSGTQDPVWGGYRIQFTDEFVRNLTQYEDDVPELIDSILPRLLTILQYGNPEEHLKSRRQLHFGSHGIFRFRKGSANDEGLRFYGSIYAHDRTARFHSFRPKSKTVHTSKGHTEMAPGFEMLLRELRDDTSHVITDQAEIARLTREILDRVTPEHPTKEDNAVRVHAQNFTALAAQLARVNSIEEVAEDLRFFSIRHFGSSASRVGYMKVAIDALLLQNAVGLQEAMAMSAAAARTVTRREFLADNPNFIALGELFGQWAALDPATGRFIQDQFIEWRSRQKDERVLDESYANFRDGTHINGLANMPSKEVLTRKPPRSVRVERGPKFDAPAAKKEPEKKKEPKPVERPKATTSVPDVKKKRRGPTEEISDVALTGFQAPPPTNPNIRTLLREWLRRRGVVFNEHRFDQKMRGTTPAIIARWNEAAIAKFFRDIFASRVREEFVRDVLAFIASPVLPALPKVELPKPESAPETSHSFPPSPPAPSQTYRLIIDGIMYEYESNGTGVKPLTEKPSRNFSAPGGDAAKMILILVGAGLMALAMSGFGGESAGWTMCAPFFLAVPEDFGFKWRPDDLAPGDAASPAPGPKTSQKKLPLTRDGMSAAAVFFYRNLMPAEEEAYTDGEDLMAVDPGFMGSLSVVNPQGRKIGDVPLAPLIKVMELVDAHTWHDMDSHEAAMARQRSPDFEAADDAFHQLCSLIGMYLAIQGISDSLEHIEIDVEYMGVQEGESTFRLKLLPPVEMEMAQKKSPEILQALQATVSGKSLYGEMSRLEKEVYHVQQPPAWVAMLDAFASRLQALTEKNKLTKADLETAQRIVRALSERYLAYVSPYRSVLSSRPKAEQVLRKTIALLSLAAQRLESTVSTEPFSAVVLEAKIQNHDGTTFQTVKYPQLYAPEALRQVSNCPPLNPALLDADSLTLVFRDKERPMPDFLSLKEEEIKQRRVKHSVFAPREQTLDPYVTNGSVTAMKAPVSMDPGAQAYVYYLGMYEIALTRMIKQDDSGLHFELRVNPDSAVCLWYSKSTPEQKALRAQRVYEANREIVFSRIDKMLGEKDPNEPPSKKLSNLLMTRLRNTKADITAENRNVKIVEWGAWLRGIVKSDEPGSFDGIAVDVIRHYMEEQGTATQMDTSWIWVPIAKYIFRAENPAKFAYERLGWSGEGFLVLVIIFTSVWYTYPLIGIGASLFVLMALHTHRVVLTSNGNYEVQSVLERNLSSQSPWWIAFQRLAWHFASFLVYFGPLFLVAWFFPKKELAVVAAAATSFAALWAFWFHQQMGPIEVKVAPLLNVRASAIGMPGGMLVWAEGKKDGVYLVENEKPLTTADEKRLIVSAQERFSKEAIFDRTVYVPKDWDLPPALIRRMVEKAAMRANLQSWFMTQESLIVQPVDLILTGGVSAPPRRSMMAFNENQRILFIDQSVPALINDLNKNFAYPGDPDTAGFGQMLFQTTLASLWRNESIDATAESFYAASLIRFSAGYEIFNDVAHRGFLPDELESNWAKRLPLLKKRADVLTMDDPAMLAIGDVLMEDYDQDEKNAKLFVVGPNGRHLTSLSVAPFLDLGYSQSANPAKTQPLIEQLASWARKYILDEKLVTSPYDVSLRIESWQSPHTKKVQHRLKLLIDQTDILASEPPVSLAKGVHENLRNDVFRKRIAQLEEKYSGQKGLPVWVPMLETFCDQLTDRLQAKQLSPRDVKTANKIVQALFDRYLAYSNSYRLSGLDGGLLKHAAEDVQHIATLLLAAVRSPVDETPSPMAASGTGIPVKAHNLSGETVLTVVKFPQLYDPDRLKELISAYPLALPKFPILDTTALAMVSRTDEPARFFIVEENQPEERLRKFTIGSARDGSIRVHVNDVDGATPHLRYDSPVEPTHGFYERLLPYAEASKFNPFLGTLRALPENDWLFSISDETGDDGTAVWIWKSDPTQAQVKKRTDLIFEANRDLIFRRIDDAVSRVVKESKGKSSRELVTWLLRAMEKEQWKEPVKGKQEAMEDLVRRHLKPLFLQSKWGAQEWEELTKKFEEGELFLLPIVIDAIRTYTAEVPVDYGIYDTSWIWVPVAKHIFRAKNPEEFAVRWLGWSGEAVIAVVSLAAGTWAASPLWGVVSSLSLLLLLHTSRVTVSSVGALLVRSVFKDGALRAPPDEVIHRLSLHAGNFFFYFGPLWAAALRAPRMESLLVSVFIWLAALGWALWSHRNDSLQKIDLADAMAEVSTPKPYLGMSVALLAMIGAMSLYTHSPLFASTVSACMFFGVGIPQKEKFLYARDGLWSAYDNFNSDDFLPPVVEKSPNFYRVITLLGQLARQWKQSTVVDILENMSIDLVRDERVRLFLERLAIRNQVFDFETATMLDHPTDDNFREFLLKIHPYRKIAQEQLEKRFIRFPQHVGGYFVLDELKENGQLPDDLLLLNVDPHNDVRNITAALNQTVNSGNWIGWVLRNKRAALCIQVTLDIRTEQPIFILYKYDVLTHAIHEEKLSQKEFQEYVARHPIALSVDADEFSLQAAFWHNEYGSRSVSVRHRDDTDALKKHVQALTVFIVLFLLRKIPIVTIGADSHYHLSSRLQNEEERQTWLEWLWENPILMEPLTSLLPIIHDVGSRPTYLGVRDVGEKSVPRRKNGHQPFHPMPVTLPDRRALEKVRAGA